MPDRRALVVGIDDYPGAPLRGCVNDAKRVAELLRTNANGSPNFDVQLLTSDHDRITRATLRQVINRLFAHRGGEAALLYFSGHGTENDLGGYLVTPDARAYDEGVNLSEVLTHANTATATERVIILDSCMSGHFGELPQVSSPASNLAEGVSVLTASRASQVSVEVDGHGVFTELVCSALEGGAADVLGGVTAPSIYCYVEEALGPWDQRPLFKAHLSRAMTIRTAAPAVPLEVLRNFTTWFPDPDAEYPLDPSYEDTRPEPNPEHVRIFKHLQRARDAKLVEAVDEEFLYFAAINSKSARLTALGKHYWRLVKDGRV